MGLVQTLGKRVRPIYIPKRGSSTPYLPSERYSLLIAGLHVSCTKKGVYAFCRLLQKVRLRCERLVRTCGFRDAWKSCGGQVYFWGKGVVLARAMTSASVCCMTRLPCGCGRQGRTWTASFEVQRHRLSVQTASGSIVLCDRFRHLSCPVDTRGPWVLFLPWSFWRSAS